MSRVGAGAPGNFSASSGGSNITQIGGASISLGQKTMANSLPVVLASDQSTLAVSLASLPALSSGTNIIGKVGIDQTTPGTTNAVVDKDTSGTSIFGTAAAMADTVANPTLGSVQSYLKGFNGSTWDRLICFFLTADGQGVQTGLYTLPQNLIFNGSTWDRLRSGGVTGMMGISGDTASAASDAGNPVKVGGIAINAEITAVTNGQRVNAVHDLVGKRIVMPYANKENFVSGTANTTGTSDTAVIAAQGSGLFIYITTITVVNTGSSASLVTIETDTASAKTAIWQVIAPAGGGTVVTFPVPIKGSVSNKNVGFVCGTGSTTVYCSIAGYAGT